MSRILSTAGNVCVCGGGGGLAWQGDMHGRGRVWQGGMRVQERQPYGNERTVRILLEYILVKLKM